MIEAKGSVSRSMQLFDYDYDDLAAQIQTGLERIAINFLRGHGARIRLDVVDFHGGEHVELELSASGHSLKVHQLGPPGGLGLAESGPAGSRAGEFESLFDGWPATNTPREE